MNSFLTKYLEYTAQTESPTNYHIWCGLSVAASCLRRLVWIDMAYWQIYPNLYVVLIGPPGCRKSVAINIATKLIEDFPDVIVSPDAITREALILELELSARMQEMGPKSNRLVMTHSSITVVSKELATFIGSGNSDFLVLLTDLFDCPDIWEYKTKNKGTNKLLNVWLNLLGASTPSWLMGSIPLPYIGGGFTSRIIFVVEHEPRHKKAWPELSDKEKRLKESLKLDLEKLSMIRGEFIPSPEAKLFFEQWYETIDKEMTDTRFKGYSARKHIQILKIALVLAACDNSEGVIEITHVELAINLLNKLESNMIDAFGTVGRSIIAADIDEVTTILRTVGSMERHQLQKVTKMNIHPKEFDNVINLLCATGEVRLEARDGKIIYKYMKEEGDG